MQNRRRRLKIIFVFILIIDSFSIKNGSCAPTNSKLLVPQKVKRSAEFMNYLSSMFYKTKTINYPDSSWNFYDSQPQPIFNYQTNFNNCPSHGNKGEDTNYINWPTERDMKAFNYFQTIPSDPPPLPAVVTYIDYDSSSLEKECGCDQHSVENDIDWNIPQHGIDESIFHNFYLIPEERDISKESYPTTTTAKPEESPNIRIFDCSSNPTQKDFLEKVLSNDNNNDEYLVLLIKRNSFLVGKEQTNKTEQTEHKLSSTNPVEVPEEIVFEEPIKSSENEKPPKTPKTLEIVNTGKVDLEFISSPKQESLTDIPSSTVSTFILAREDTAKQNKDETFIEADQVSKVTMIENDLQETTSTQRSIKIPASTIMTPIAIPSEEDVKVSETPFNQGHDTILSTEAPTELNKSILEIPVHTQAIANVEIPTTIETEGITKVEEKVSEVATEANNLDPGEVGIGLPKEKELKIAEENQRTVSEIMKQQQESTAILPSIENTDGISGDILTPVISSQIENAPLQNENTSEVNLNSAISDSTNIEMTSEKPTLPKEVTSVNTNEGERLILNSFEDKTEPNETIEVPKLDENAFDSISTSTSKPIEYFPSLLSD